MGEPFRFFGFTRDEWALAYAHDPATGAQFLVFLDVAAGLDNVGGLCNIGTDSLLAIARVSPAFARRVRDQLALTDPNWRDGVQRLLRPPPGLEDSPGSAQTLALWADLFAVLDAAGP